MSVLGLYSVYKAKYGLNPREFPRAVPPGTPLGSGHISPYIPPLLLIQIQYLAPMDSFYKVLPFKQAQEVRAKRRQYLLKCGLLNSNMTILNSLPYHS